jgi:hypothetical protein
VYNEGREQRATREQVKRARNEYRYDRAEVLA